MSYLQAKGRKDGTEIAARQGCARAWAWAESQAQIILDQQDADAVHGARLDELQLASPCPA
jgi:hypothetical protein